MEYFENPDRLVVEEYVWLDSRGKPHTGFAIVTWWEYRCLMKHVTGPNGERPIFGSCWLVRIHSDPYIDCLRKDWQEQLERMLRKRQAA
jgi:hypothetical protein